MKLLENLRKIEYLDYLIAHSATGTPQQLACKLKLSVRQVFRLIDELRSVGLPIEYSKVHNSYVYTATTKIRIEISTSGKRIF